MEKSWMRTSISKMTASIKESRTLMFHIKTLGYLPAIFVYGITLIFLLKFSQVLLGWDF